MRKRVVSGLILACILVPTFFWAKDMIAPIIGLASSARALSETWQRVGAWFEDKTAEAYEADINAEETRLSQDIEGTITAVSDLDGDEEASKVSQLKGYLAHLLSERQHVQDLKRRHLYNLNARRLVAEEFRQMRLRQKAAQEQWASAEKMVRIHAAMDHEEKRQREERLAALVNKFLDEVEALNVVGARELCVKELKPSLTKDRLKTLRQSLAESSAEEFDLKSTSAKSYDVLFDGEKKLGLTRKGGEWLVSKLL